MNKHLNLFYTYQANHLEDNVTRALIITLKHLSPINLRLFFKEVIFSQLDSNKEIFMKKLNLFSKQNFKFETQVSTFLESIDFSDDENKLTSENGLIVGINYSGKQPLNLSPKPDKDSVRSRLDGLISDNENCFSLIFETKLWDWLYEEQIENYYNNYFNIRKTPIKSISVQITWTEIVKFLSKIESISNDLKERFIVHDFIEYCDFLNLTDFRIFYDRDFSGKFNYDKLNKLLALLCNDLQKELNNKEYTYNNRIHFEETSPDNLWIDFNDNDSLIIGIVCGSGKKWRAEGLKSNLKQSSDKLKIILEQLNNTSIHDLKLDLNIHSYFHYSRFRRAWLGHIGGSPYRYPEQFYDFIKTFTDDEKNFCQYYDKRNINEIFKDEINKMKPSVAVDSNGLFPHWDDIKKFLQYSYFHIDTIIPKSFFIGKEYKSILNDIKPLLKDLKEAMLQLEQI